MKREILSLILLILLGLINIISLKKKQFRLSQTKPIVLTAALFIIIAELCCFAAFVLGYRLTGNYFGIYLLICILYNVTIFIIVSQKKRRAIFLIIAALSALMALYYTGFISCENVVIGDKEYAAEYENVTGISETRVYCYEKKNKLFTDNKCACVINCGIVLDGKPNFEESIKSGNIERK